MEVENSSTGQLAQKKNVPPVEDNVVENVEEQLLEEAKQDSVMFNEQITRQTGKVAEKSDESGLVLPLGHKKVSPSSKKKKVRITINS